MERFATVGPRRKQTIAIVSFAGRAEVARDGRLRGVRIGAGAVAPTPKRAHGVEALVEGRRPDSGLRHEAVAVLHDDMAPIDDVRASAAYRRMAAAVGLDRFPRSAKACRERAGHGQARRQR